jgi:hypothetical protein
MVRIYAVPAGTISQFQIGQGPSDGLGNWTITTSPLADGVYAILATAVNTAGRTVSPSTELMPTPSHGPLVITHSGPQIAGVSFDPNTSGVQITVQDLLAGLNPGVLSNPLGYTLTEMTARGSRPIPISGIAITPRTPAGSVTVSLSFGGGLPLGRGTYVLELSGAGIVDLAGNPVGPSTFAPDPALAPAPGIVFAAEYTVGGRRGIGSPRTFVPPGQRRAASRFGQFLRSHSRFRFR